MAVLGLNCGNLMECQKNVLKIQLNQTGILYQLADHPLLPEMNFNGHWLIKKISFPRKVINLYISYTLAPQLGNLNTDFTLANCFFGSVKLIKNADLDKYKYTRYSIGFASRIFIYRWKLWNKCHHF